jgi:hypothetical protein
VRVEHIGDATQKVTAIYALCEYPSWVPRYVGKTVQYLHERHKAHIRAAKRGGRLPVHYWLRKRISANQRLAIRLLEYVPGGADWASRERAWIERYRAEGRDLLNLTAGGEGLAGHSFSAEHRRRIAAALCTGATMSCLRCGSQFWRKRNEINKGNAKYCSRGCYAAAQVGVPKTVPTPVAAIDAAAAMRRAMTHCKRGHPLSGENLFINQAGSRGCRECRRIHKRTYLGNGK